MSIRRRRVLMLSMAMMTGAVFAAVAVDTARVLGPFSPGFVTAVVCLVVGVATVCREPRSSASLLLYLGALTAGVFYLSGFDARISGWAARAREWLAPLLPAGGAAALAAPMIPAPLGIAAATLLALTVVAFLRSRFGSAVGSWFDSGEYDSDVKLAELSDRLAGAHGIASVVEESGELLADVFAPLETLVFLEQKGGRLWLHSADPEKRRELRLPDEIAGALRQGEIVGRDDAVAGDLSAHGLWRELGIDLLLPLRGSPLFGVLALGARSCGRDYTPRDIRFLRTACNQLALGLTKATLFEQMEEDAGISAALVRAQNEIAFSLNAPDILDRLCRITATALEVERSHTLMWDAARVAFGAVSIYGESAEEIEKQKLLRVPRDVVGDLLVRLKSEDAIVSRGHRYRVLAELFNYDPSALIIMPLRREGELIGLHLAGCSERAPQFTSRHERVARGIGHAASMALANAYLMEELASASRVKSDFVASMSHELRTPLNHIIGYNDLLLDGAFGAISEEQQDTLQRVRRSSHNLLDLIEATLNLSRLDANKVAVDLREVNVPNLVAELADRLEHSCRKPGVEVEWKVRREISTLRTDPIKLQMILKNLVENAVKFTARGRVVITVKGEGNGVEFEVSDSGAGIPRELQSAIFEPFRRVHDPNASPGVGLGLHIVRRLIDLMQGTISVASEVNLGSCFRVWLPACPEVAAAGEAEETRPPLMPLSATLH